MSTNRTSNFTIRHCAVADKGGVIAEAHWHKSPHLSIILRGEVRVFTGKSLATLDYKDYQGPTEIEIPGGQIHKFVALADNTEVWCVFAGDDI